MSIAYKKFEDFGNILADDILDKLVGNHDDFKRQIWNDHPSKNILLGVLHGFTESDETKMEDKRLVNSLSVKFLLDEFKDDININFEFFVYYRVLPNFEEQKSIKRAFQNRFSVAVTIEIRASSAKNFQSE